MYGGGRIRGRPKRRLAHGSREYPDDIPAMQGIESGSEKKSPCYTASLPALLEVVRLPRRLRGAEQESASVWIIFPSNQ